MLFAALAKKPHAVGLAVGPEVFALWMDRVDAYYGEQEGFSEMGFDPVTLELLPFFAFSIWMAFSNSLSPNKVVALNAAEAKAFQETGSLADALESGAHECAWRPE